MVEASSKLSIMPALPIAAKVRRSQLHFRRNRGFPSPSLVGPYTIVVPPVTRRPPLNQDHHHGGYGQGSAGNFNIKLSCLRRRGLCIICGHRRQTERSRIGPAAHFRQTERSPDRSPAMAAYRCCFRIRRHCGFLSVCHRICHHITGVYEALLSSFELAALLSSSPELRIGAIVAGICGIDAIVAGVYGKCHAVDHDVFLPGLVAFHTRITRHE